MIDAKTWDALVDGAVARLPVLGVGAIMLLAFWIAASVASAAISRLGRSRRLDPDVTGLLAQSSKVALLIFGVITALGTIGIDVTALVAGLGLTSLALGLALKEVVSNAIAGALILLYKPFKRGDTVAVLAFKGIASEINLRYTTLDTPDGRVFVPNTLLLTNAMVVAPGPNGRRPTGPTP